MKDMPVLQGDSSARGVAVAGNGRPLEIPLDLIDFDPTQPRKSIDDAALNELARTIEQCGVIQPISVRVNASDPGRFVVNVGERRVRACRLVNRFAVPAFVAESIDPYARVIENLVREALSPFELAAFVLEREKLGEPRVAIAQRLGKSKTFVTEIASLGDAPSVVRDAYTDGRCGDVRSLYLLRRAHALDPVRVEAAIARAGPLTRGRVEAIARSVNDAARADCDASNERIQSRTRRIAAILVRVDERIGYLSLRQPASMCGAEVAFHDGSRETVELGRIRLIQWVQMG